MSIEEHVNASWAQAQRIGTLRGHIRLTIADLDDMIKETSPGALRLAFNIIRKRLVDALQKDEEEVT